MAIYTINTFNQDEYLAKYAISKEDKLEYGEIYTPFSLITQMLNLFEPTVFQNPHKTWLDIGAGQGFFSMLLFHRLNEGLTTHFPDETELKTDFVQKMLSMVELKKSNIAALRNMFGPTANILEGDFCIQEFKHHYDYILGNPPYNAHGMKKVPTNKVAEKKADGITLWTQFIRKSLPLLQPSTGQLCLIVPALWLKADKNGLHPLLTHYKIEKIHCFSSNETNKLFKGAAQTPTCYFLLTNTPKVSLTAPLQLYDSQRRSYVTFPHTPGQPIPLFGAHIIQKLQPWLSAAGPLKVFKTNMPSPKSQFTEEVYTQTHPYVNITTCILEGLQPVLVLNYSDIPQAFHGMKKLVLAHKMYGFPYWDKEGHYGIANRDNYVITGKSDLQFAQLQAFLSTKFALYLFEAAR